MKAYHIRDVSEEYKKDCIFIPESNLFVAYLQDPKIKVIINYSSKAYLDRATAIIEGKDVGIKTEVVSEFETDEKTALKIMNNRKNSRFRVEEFDGSTKNLIRILSGANRKKGLLGRLFGV